MEADLLKRLATPVLVPVQVALSATGLPLPLHDALASLVDSSGLVLVAGALALGGSANTREHGVPRLAAAASALLAAGLAAWMLQHPSERFDDVFQRWDHLAFAGLAGLAAAALARGGRKWLLAAVSLGVLLQYAGAVAVALAVALTAIGVALLHTRLRANALLMAAVQAALIVAVYGLVFRLRASHPLAAARAQGLLAFWMLRHVSLLVTAARSGPPALADCTTFMSFYPGAMGLLGAPEVYDEFARRNLARSAQVNRRTAARRLVEGVVLVAAAKLVPASLERVEASPTTALAWGFAILLFVRTALFAMGWWRWVDATALFYGIRMRANFSGLLSCRNPSELWWAWRGTLTNWLVQHVYAPLGANRRHQSLNILAAFVVSFLWHALGVPFLVPDFRLTHLTALGLWAGVNATAVILHVNVARTGLARATAVVPAPARIAAATVLTWTLGSLTPVLLSYQGAAAERLPDLLRVLAGLR
jgi:MBOAT, membrane-bound O-acyltransferase family